MRRESRRVTRTPTSSFIPRRHRWAAATWKALDSSSPTPCRSARSRWLARTGGPADFVNHNQTGLVVDGEDVEAIVSALRSVLESEERLAQLSRAGREFCLNDLSWDRHVQTILEALPS